MHIWHGEGARAQAVTIEAVASNVIVLYNSKPPVVVIANDTAGANYAEQCAAGRRQARALLQRISAEDSPHLLVYAVRDLMRSGRAWSGVEAGFFHAIAETAV